MLMMAGHLDIALGFLRDKDILKQYPMPDSAEETNPTRKGAITTNHRMVSDLLRDTGHDDRLERKSG